MQEYIPVSIPGPNCIAIKQRIKKDAEEVSGGNVSKFLLGLYFDYEKRKAKAKKGAQ